MIVLHKFLEFVSSDYCFLESARVCIREGGGSYADDPLYGKTFLSKDEVADKPCSRLRWKNEELLEVDEDEITFEEEL